MTSQYVACELSWRLARLQTAMISDAAANNATAHEVARLRQMAETCPLPALGSVLRCALRAADAACWRSLARGDIAAFAEQVEVSSDLYGFGVCGPDRRPARNALRPLSGTR
jgi:hypothetical protein